MKVLGIHTTNDVTVIRVRRWWFWFDEWANDGNHWRRLRDGRLASDFSMIDTMTEHRRLANALEASKLREKVYGAT